MTGQRGQSEVLGFVLVFALVLSTVAIISVFGFGALEDTRDEEELNNAERAFDVLADNLADIHGEGAPSRATEISLQNAELYGGDRVKFNVTVINQSGNVSVNEYNIDPIVFSQGDTDIVYANGAILRDQRDGGVFVKEPPMLIDEDRVVLPVIQTELDGDTTSVGGQTIRVRAEKQSRRPIPDLVESPSRYQEVILNITSSRSDIWKTYLESQGASDDFVECVQPREDNVRCSMGTGTTNPPEEIYLSTTLVSWEIES